MATKKNQHFVPRCYLKPFSLNGEGRAINVFNLDLNKAVPDAPLKNQCSRDYFYGKDLVVENALGFVEGTYGTIIEEILGPGYRLNVEHREFLQIFWSLQHLRTEALSMRTAEMWAAFETEGGLPAGEYRMSIKEALATSLKMLPTVIMSIRDLKIVFIRNRTGLPFITSDDPAVITNRWAQCDPRNELTGAGIQSAGALGLLPMSPDVFMLAYDGDVYSVEQEKGWAYLTREADVAAFNELQFLNCRANVYFSDWNDRDRVASNYQVAAVNRPPNRHKIHYAVLDSINADGGQTFREVPSYEAEEHEHAIIHTETIDPKPSRWPSLICWRSNGNVWRINSGASYARRAMAINQPGQTFTRERARIPRI